MWNLKYKEDLKVYILENLKFDKTILTIKRLIFRHVAHTCRSK